MLTEEKAIAVINELIDADMRTGAEMVASDLARRAIARLGEGVIDEKAVADLVGQVFTARFEPWMALPGAKPRLKGWGERVVRLIPKPTPMDILYEGQEAGEPLEATFARIGAAYPELTGDEMQAVIQDYQAWLQNRIERQKALARGLDRVHG